MNVHDVHLNRQILAVEEVVRARLDHSVHLHLHLRLALSCVMLRDEPRLPDHVEARQARLRGNYVVLSVIIAAVVVDAFVTQRGESLEIGLVMHATLLSVTEVVLCLDCTDCDYGFHLVILLNSDVLN